MTSTIVTKFRKVWHDVAKSCQRHKPAPTTFTRFSDLPNEIQLMIWREAINDLEPRVLKLLVRSKHKHYHGEDHVHFSSESVPPLFLSLTQTSRDAMVKAYSSIIQPRLERIIRFHYRDTILLIPLPVLNTSLGSLVMNEGLYPTFSGTIIQSHISGVRSVNSNLAMMLSGIERLAIPRVWLYAIQRDWEDRTTKALFLAHFPNLRTLIFTRGGPDAPLMQHIPKGDIEVYLQDELENEEHAVRRSSDRDRDAEVAEIRYWSGQKMERAIAKLHTFQVEGIKSSVETLQVEFNVVRRDPPSLWGLEFGSWDTCNSAR